MKRTPETFAAHLRTRVASCGTFHIALKSTDLLGSTFLIVPNMCSSNYCPPCRKKNLQRLRSALTRTMARDRWRLVTLTFEQQNTTPSAILLALRTTLARFIRLVRKRYPAVKFVRTIELHKNGYPHVHMTISRYIPQSFLQVQWNKVGGGIADISAGTHCRKCGKLPPCEHIATKRKVTYKDAARYLTEEVEKAAQDPHSAGEAFWCSGLRSITLSRNLKLRDTASPWQYAGAIHNEDEMDYYFMLTDPRCHPRDAIVPSVAFRGSAAVIGPGVV